MLKFEIVGMIGWKEFETNRSELISRYEQAKLRGYRRPLPTDKGITAEFAIREWLRRSLPKKFGVTSGYIIAPLREKECATRYHYDVIIYDAINAPVLWDEDTDGRSDGASPKAIPVKYVLSVIEVKSQFNERTVNECYKKLYTLNEFKSYLPVNFSCRCIFFEFIDSKLNKKGHRFIKKMIKFHDISGLANSLIIKSAFDPANSGNIELLLTDDSIRQGAINKDAPIHRVLTEQDIFLNSSGKISMQGPNVGCRMVVHDNEFLFSFRYICSAEVDGRYVGVSWSRNIFAEFYMKLMRDLEGSSFQQREQFYGLSFERLIK